MGLSNIWTRKDLLIDMILKNSQPVTSHDAAPLLHPDQASRPLLFNDQLALDNATCSLLPDTAPVLRPDNAPPRHPNGAKPQLANDKENAQPLHPDAAQPLTLDDAQQIRHDAAQPQHADIVLQGSQDAVTPPHTDTASPQRVNHAQPPHPENDSRTANSAVEVNEDETETDIQKIARDLKNIHNKLATKDMEIELLNEEVKMAYETIDALQHRITALEQRNITSGERQRHLQTDAPPSTTHCLLLGDSNLRRVLSSDLGENCSVKTIYNANIDLIRKRITEQLYKTPTECIL